MFSISVSSSLSLSISLYKNSFPGLSPNYREIFMMSSADAASQKFIVLKSYEGQSFVVTEAVAVKSEMIRSWIMEKSGVADNSAETMEFSVENVTSKILEKVIEYCKRHVEAAGGEDLKSFDANFVNVDLATLYRLIRAAMYLQIQSLLDLTAQTLAGKIKGMTAKTFRSTFNIKNSFSTNDEDRFLNKHPWAR